MMLLWIDLETTGLDPANDYILEVAAVLSTFEKPFVGEEICNQVIAQPGLRLKRMGEVVREMHTKSGLLDAVYKSTTSLSSVEDQLLGYAPEATEQDDKLIVAGSNVGKFDLAFIQHHMPRLFARLSYRAYDVTPVKLFLRSLGMDKFPKAEAHRAMADVRESMAHAKACADWLCNDFKQFETKIKHGLFRSY